MTTGLLSPTHLAVVLLIALLILGPRRLPQTGRALGRAMREFRDGISGRDRDEDKPSLELPGAGSASDNHDAAVRKTT